LAVLLLILVLLLEVSATTPALDIPLAVWALPLALATDLRTFPDLLTLPVSMVPTTRDFPVLPIPQVFTRAPVLALALTLVV
jgi:hypothetical protein